VTAIALSFVKAYSDRHGKMRYYFRRKGFPKVALPSPGSPGFMAAYEAANIAPTTSTLGFLPGSLGWTIEKFVASEEYAQRAANTRLTYSRTFDELRKEFGAGLMRDLQSRHVKKIRDHFRQKFTASVADAALGCLSVLWQYADNSLDLNLNSNPTTGVARVHKAKEENERQPWTDSVFATFEANAPGQLRLAVILLLYTGQRVSDVVKMRWSHFDGEFIEVVQQKTGQYVSIPCHQRLKATLLTLSRAGEFILAGERRESYKAGSVSTLVRRVLNSNGIKGYSVHGLRKNAVQKLAEAGCDVQEIMAITGHRSIAMALHYAKRAERKRLARRAMDRWDAAEVGAQAKLRRVK
jgi:integrase